VRKRAKESKGRRGGAFPDREQMVSPVRVRLEGKTCGAFLPARLRPPLRCGSSEAHAEVTSPPRPAANAGDLGIVPQLPTSGR
jgi:hypothetical protein